VVTAFDSGPYDGLVTAFDSLDITTKKKKLPKRHIIVIRLSYECHTISYDCHTIVIFSPFER
jgi:hypothetical protein